MISMAVPPVSVIIAAICNVKFGFEDTLSKDGETLQCAHPADGTILTHQTSGCCTDKPGRVYCIFKHGIFAPMSLDVRLRHGRPDCLVTVATQRCKHRAAHNGS